VILQQLCAARGLTLAQLAERAGVPLAVVAKLDAGTVRPQAPTLRRLATALDLAPEALRDEFTAARRRQGRPRGGSIRGNEATARRPAPARTWPPTSPSLLGKVGGGTPGRRQERLCLGGITTRAGRSRNHQPLDEGRRHGGRAAGDLLRWASGRGLPMLGPPKARHPDGRADQDGAAGRGAAAARPGYAGPIRVV
jgi:transcriptional regulator with XRE-family HTH domain